MFIKYLVAIDSIAYVAKNTYHYKALGPDLQTNRHTQTDIIISSQVGCFLESLLQCVNTVCI